MKTFNKQSPFHSPAHICGIQLAQNYKIGSERAWVARHASIKINYYLGENQLPIACAWLAM